MEPKVYTIPEDRREEVEKLISRYQRKAIRYNVPLEVSMGKPYAETVRYWRDNKVVHEELIEVFDLEIMGDEIRNGNYSVVAKLEHLDGGNIVSVIGNAEINDEWRHADCHCDHCGTNRDRKLTFIVRDGNGSEKQVGKTCLKDYCGIDPNGIGIANELHDVFLDYDINEVREYDPDCPVGSRAYRAMEVLALAIRVSKKQGYIKSDFPGSNKQTMLDAYDMYHMLRNPIKPEERAEAEAMAAGITSMTDEETAFTVLGNVKLLLKAGYCKFNHFGFFAYAPIAWKDYQQKLEVKRQREEEAETARKSSDYVGEIGKRITINVTEAKYITSWFSGYGDGETHLYKFLDTDGNVYVWFASKMIDEAEVKSIKGTVKAHNERDGIKQTVLTRCKVA